MKTPQNDNVPYDLISRYFLGECSVDEIIDVEIWKAASSENERILKHLRLIWEKTGQISEVGAINIDEEWNTFVKAVSPERQSLEESKGKFLLPLYKLAGVIVIGLILGLATVWLNDSIKFEKVVAGNEMKVIQLPDGSSVYLNRESEIKYAKSFLKSRDLSLNGEAFFDVVPDSTKAFLIKTGDLRVKVLGTSFNVRAFSKEESVKVIVESGKVAVYQKSSVDEKDILQKGEKIAYYRKSGEKKLSKNLDVNYRSWYTGILNFENASLEEVLNKLTQIYNVDFKLSNNKLYGCRISVRFEHSELEYILKTLSLTLDISFENKTSYILVTGDGC